MAKHEVRYEGALTRDQAIATLERLTAALREGPLRIAAGGRSLVIAPSEILGVELEVSQRRGKSKLELELTWREYPAADEGIDLVIEPAPAEAEAAEEAEAAAEDEDEDDDDDDEAEAEAEAADGADSGAVAQAADEREGEDPEAPADGAAPALRVAPDGDEAAAS